MPQNTDDKLNRRNIKPTAMRELDLRALTAQTNAIRMANLEAKYIAVAKAGHDTDKIKAYDKVYTSLPGCCKVPEMILLNHSSLRIENSLLSILP